MQGRAAASTVFSSPFLTWKCTTSANGPLMALMREARSGALSLPSWARTGQAAARRAKAAVRRIANIRASMTGLGDMVYAEQGRPAAPHVSWQNWRVDYHDHVGVPVGRRCGVAQRQRDYQLR